MLLYISLRVLSLELTRRSILGPVCPTKYAQRTRRMDEQELAIFELLAEKNMKYVSCVF